MVRDLGEKGKRETTDESLNCLRTWGEDALMRRRRVRRPVSKDREKIRPAKAGGLCSSWSESQTAGADLWQK